MTTFHFISKRIKNASVLLMLVFASVFVGVPAKANVLPPTPLCTETLCTVTFEYSGQGIIWSPPEGITSLSFDIQGAQGGRNSGKGGRVSGVFLSVPDSIHVYVGGSGKVGTFAPGGFNGGGAAGGYWNDEASGGGATDIRTSTNIQDRFVVAGGGGGRGGGSGAFGGAGGSLVAESGLNGQGFGGAGGTQTAGGIGGARNGSGQNGFDGSFFEGGKGGTSFSMGGGGGGGGYYGGGGGGSDTNECCSDGGGGGGGSSYANSLLTSDIVHTSGFKSGDGLVVLSYPVPPSVSSFESSLSLTNVNQIEFSLLFSQSVTDLSQSDFSFLGTSCQSLAISGSGATYTITVSGCVDGEVSLEIASGSVSGLSASGPVESAESSVVLLDTVAPEIVFEDFEEVVNSPALEFGLLISEPISGILESSFEVFGKGCELATVSIQHSSIELEVSGCLDESEVEVEVDTSAVVDIAGNQMVASTLRSITRFVSLDKAVVVPVPEETPLITPTPETDNSEDQPAELVPPSSGSPEDESGNQYIPVPETQEPEEAAPVAIKPIIEPKTKPSAPINEKTSFEREVSEDVGISKAEDQIVEESEVLEFRDAALVAYPVEEQGGNYVLWFVALAAISAGVGILIFRKVPPHPAMG